MTNELPYTLEELLEGLEFELAKKFMEKQIPQIYQRVDVNRIPDRVAFLKVLECETELDSSEKFGFYAFGETGLAKTRAMCARLALSADNWTDADIVFCRGPELSSRIVELTKPLNDDEEDDRDDFDEWMRSLKTCDALGIDELDKIAFSPRVANEIGTLIEVRFSNRRPTYFTAQCGLDTLGNKLSKKNKDNAKENADALVRRIVEFCHPIRFRRAQ